MSGIVREERFGDCRLLLGDCRKIAPSLGDAFAVVSDPPYGMAFDTNSTRFTSGMYKRGDGRADWGAIEGDAQPFDPAPWLAYRECILWGANHYAQRLPVGATLIWLKKAPHLFGTFLSDAEIGWKKGGHGVFCHFRQFPPPSRMAENDGRSPAHPTQKPLSLMRWCLGMVKAPAILDPFMGSGTTGVACAHEGRAFVGIEMVERHFDTACRRVEQAVREAAQRPRDMFEAPPATPVQEAFL